MLEIRWCGRILSLDGICFDPRRINGICNMDEPTKGGELKQFIGAMQWICTPIPAFTSIILPLSVSLEAVYAKAGSRKKSVVGRVVLANRRWPRRILTLFIEPRILWRIKSPWLAETPTVVYASTPTPQTSCGPAWSRKSPSRTSPKHISINVISLCASSQATSLVRPSVGRR